MVTGYLYAKLSEQRFPERTTKRDIGGSAMSGTLNQPPKNEKQTGKRNKIQKDVYQGNHFKREKRFHT